MSGENRATTGRGANGGLLVLNIDDGDHLSSFPRAANASQEEIPGVFTSFNLDPVLTGEISTIDLSGFEVVDTDCFKKIANTHPDLKVKLTDDLTIDVGILIGLFDLISGQNIAIADLVNAYEEKKPIIDETRTAIENVDSSNEAAA